MDLEFQAAPNVAGSYGYEISDGEPMVIDWEPMIRQILCEQRANAESSVISAKFHNTLAAMVVDMAKRIGQQRVVLTGGCFQNRYLTERVVEYLSQAGFSAYWHQRVPPNDGGIALGQVMAAQQATKQETSCVLQFQAR